MYVLHIQRREQMRRSNFVKSQIWQVQYFDQKKNIVSSIFLYKKKIKQVQYVRGQRIIKEARNSFQDKFVSDLGYSNPFFWQ